MEVFISHSHHDRHEATKIRDLLERHGAQAFFDQEEIHPGDDLPDRILQGIKDCDFFLLVWSRNAARSEWVQNEWNLAYDERKKILPYVLDSTPLPQGLSNLVYIDHTDQKHGNALLLKTIFPGYIPPPGDLFPGQWRATVDFISLGQATFDIELRSNGQIEGQGRLEETGIFGQFADPSMHELFDMSIPIHGNWHYDDDTQVLTLETVSSGFGQTQRDLVIIHTTGQEHGAINGTDRGGRVWVLQRVGEAPSRSHPDDHRLHIRNEIQDAYDQLKDTQVLCAFLSAACMGIQAKGDDLGLPQQLLFSAAQLEPGSCERMLEILKQNGWLRSV
ncbi:MAG: toll/interleukin-1 receptor domain-containing protein [Candidatus Thiodiazotropha sp.]